MDFLKTYLSSCLGALTALIAFFFLSIVFVSILIGGLMSVSEDKVILEENSVLHLKLDAQINEMQQENPLAGLPIPGGEVQKIGLLQLKQAIANAKDDDKIRGIYLEVSQPMAGFSSIEEIRESLIDFKENGKWIVAYNEVMSEGAYYLSSVADEIYLNPQGEVEFNGLTINIGFYKKLFDKLEIKPQIFRVGEFKSAVEPFLMEKMSAENRLQLTELANGIYDYMLTRIAESRDIEKARLEEISDKMLVRNAPAAVELGLVDSLLYRDQFIEVLKNKLEIDDDDDIKFVKYNRYRKSFSTYKSSKNEIAVIVADGTIMPGDGNQNDQVIGADKFVEEIRKARTDDDIKAIVLRVNSPGGEFKASDMMWREITLASEAKPVIGSMGDYAASGGYYLAMACDTIVAMPHTITGSIGIFGIMFDMSDFLGDKLGITFDEVRTGDFGDTYTVTRPLTEAEKNFIQRNLNEYYETFTSKAAEGRDVAHEEIQKVASGRVWTGAQALDRNLVDVLGGFNDAVKIAAEKAGVEDDYKVRFYPTPKNFLEELMSSLEENAEAGTIKARLGELYPWYQQVRKIQQYQGAQARMPFELHFH
ncbi:MAG: signal peptide peptidase SppA [Cyclobacteriaceae bacterium]